jgi:peptidyl-tRNA hydrolase
MTYGKAASQAGHAFLDAFLQAPPESQQAYKSDDGGTKIVLWVPDETSLVDIYYKARMAGLPCAMVIESKHVMPPDFDGSPIPTAVGIGPCRRSMARPVTKGLPTTK